MDDADDPERATATLPAPDLPPLSASPTLDELLEIASRPAAIAWAGNGSVVGECLDTHNPSLPYRVLVRARDADGEAITGWLPVMAHVRVRVGDKLLLDKPDNWPEPIVMGVIAGLDQASPEPDAASSASNESDARGPELRLEQNQGIVVTGPTGEALLELQATSEGLRIALLANDVSLDAAGCLRFGADRIELHAREGGVDIRTEGNAVVRGKFIRLN